MRLSALALASAISLTLAACASTNTENPNYQASTKYKGSVPTVQQANYQTQAPAPVTYQPAPTTIAATYQPIIEPAPGIQETVDAPGDIGTPGYYAVNDIEEPVTQAAEIAPPAIPAPVSIPVTAPIITEAASTSVHTIIPGDTVYSLARNACIKVADLKQANGINDEFYIRVGDEIQIPAGRCEN